MDSKQRVTVYLSQEVMIELRRQAKGNNISRSAQLGDLVLKRSADVTYSPEDMKAFIQGALDRFLQNLKDLLNNKGHNSDVKMTEKVVKRIVDERIDKKLSETFTPQY